VHGNPAADLDADRCHLNPFQPNLLTLEGIALQPVNSQHSDYFFQLPQIPVQVFG